VLTVQVHNDQAVAVQHRKLLIQTGGRHHEREFTSWKNVCEGREV
jgi:hypothetical protein